MLAIALASCTSNLPPSTLSPPVTFKTTPTSPERVSLLFVPDRDSIQLADSAIALAASYLQSLPLGDDSDGVLADAARYLTGDEGLAIAPNLDLSRVEISANIVASDAIELADVAVFLARQTSDANAAEEIAQWGGRLLGADIGAEAIATPVLPLEASGAIAGRVWQDENENGRLDAGELALAGRTVYLDRDLDGSLGGGDVSTVTDAGGRYQFDRLFPGTYAVAARSPQLLPFPAIVGGTPAPPGEWPWMVAIVRADEPALSGHVCGATVVHPQWVLTAAHCLFRNITIPLQPDEIDIVVGRNRLSAAGGDRIAVEHIVTFPGYDISGSSLVNDIGLIKLARSTSAPVVEIARPRDQRLSVASGVSASVLGWGRTQFDDENSKSDDLLQVSLPIVSDRLCREVYAGRLEIPVASICAGFTEGGADACVGDSGGPLLVPYGDRLLQVGLVSFGDGCAEPNSPGVYTRIADFEPWIVETIGSSVSKAQIVSIPNGESISDINISG